MTRNVRERCWTTLRHLERLDEHGGSRTRTGAGSVHWAQLEEMKLAKTDRAQPNTIQITARGGDVLRALEVPGQREQLADRLGGGVPFDSAITAMLKACAEETVKTRAPQLRWMCAHRVAIEIGAKGEDRQWLVWRGDDDDVNAPHAWAIENEHGEATQVRSAETLQWLLAAALRTMLRNGAPDGEESKR